MKYLLLIYSNPASWVHPTFLYPQQELSEPERAELIAQDAALMAELTASGELVSAQALAAPERARTIQLTGDSPTVTDGPYAESKEQLAGFYVIDCATQERAIELTKRFPSARSGPIELRPLAGPNGEDI